MNSYAVEATGLCSSMVLVKTAAMRYFRLELRIFRYDREKYFRIEKPFFLNCPSEVCNTHRACFALKEREVAIEWFTYPVGYRTPKSEVRDLFTSDDCQNFSERLRNF